MSKKSYDLPNIQRPEDVELYLKSFNLGRTLQAEIDRVAAFSAIRRAAKVARMYDCHCASCPAAHRAKLIRRAIRAAIGSAKA